MKITGMSNEAASGIALADQLRAFMAEHVYPNERRYYLEAERLGPWAVSPVVEELKPLARAAGLWNLFLPASELADGLSNAEYAPLCEIMGHLPLASLGYSSSRMGGPYPRDGSPVAGAIWDVPPLDGAPGALEGSRGAAGAAWSWNSSGGKSRDLQNSEIRLFMGCMSPVCWP